MAPKGYLAQRAEAASRDYVTPEDVQAAIHDRAPLVALWGELIAILAKQRGLGVEDASLCCFNALRYEDDREPTEVDWGTFSGERHG